MKARIPLNKWMDSDVEAHWDSVASIYVQENERVSEVHSQRFKESVQHLELVAGQQVLNITSRDGAADDYIADTCPDCTVTHAEISGGLIKIASELRPFIRQVKIDSYSQLPFANGSYQRILSLETLEHVADPLAFLKELHRVSSRDAILVLSCPPATSELPYRIYSLLFGGHGEGPHRFPPSRRVKAMFGATGWKLTLHKGTVLFPVGPRWFRRWGERIIENNQKSCISELGIRQFYVCNKL